MTHLPLRLLSPDRCRRFALAIATAVIAAVSIPASAEGTIQRWIESFADSDIQFSRARTNAPFIPITWLEVTRYSDTDVDSTAIGGQQASFDQTVVSQAAGIPFLLNERNMLVVGEWVNWSDFDARSSSATSFDVTSVGLPIGMLRQHSDKWQGIGFVMPLGSKSSLPGSDWSWEYMGGVFGRYTANDDLWWAFGIFADIQSGDDIVLPYVGASWTIDEEWTLSAILPWPAIIYAPNKNTMFKFGFSPSGTSWGLNSTSGDTQFDLNTVDAGFSLGQRVYRNLWMNLEVGVGGLRALSLTGGQFNGMSLDIDSTTFISLGINYRPSLHPYRPETPKSGS